MNKTLYWWQFSGFVFVCVFGSLLHFLYDWTGGSVLVAPFSAVNESTAEHMKLFFFPAFIFAIVQYFYVGKTYPNFWCAKLIGISAGLISIPVIFYTFTGAFGMSPDWVNVLIFFLSSAIAFLTETRLMLTGKLCIPYKICLFVLILIAVLFLLFTFVPPKLPLFQDPTDNSFGIPK